MMHLLIILLIFITTTKTVAVNAAEYYNYGGYKTNYARKETVHQQMQEQHDDMSRKVQPAAAVDVSHNNTDEYPWLGLARIKLFNSNDTVVETFDCIGSLIYEDIFISTVRCIHEGITRDDSLDWSGRFYLGSNNSFYRISGYSYPGSYNYPASDMAFVRLLNSTTIPPAIWNTKTNIPSPSDTNAVVATTNVTTTIPGTNETNTTTVVSSSFVKVDVQSISKGECRDQSDYRIGITTTCTNLPSTTENNSILCNSPPGGPLVTTDGILIGIASFVSDASSAASCISSTTTTQQAIGFTETSKLQIFMDRIICDESMNPPKGCVGFCGLIGANVFCPLKLGGAFIQLLRRLLNGTL